MMKIEFRVRVMRKTNWNNIIDDCEFTKRAADKFEEIERAETFATDPDPASDTPQEIHNM